jgi:hypothetical protein
MGIKFQIIATKGVNYFSTLFKEDSCATIVEVLKMSNSFPSFVTLDDNQV